MCYFILSVTPQYLWTVQKISDSRIHGSNPIAAHGNVKAEDGGLQLNGVDAWLDAGDFYGQCLGDPDLCIKGFSFALQVQHLTLIPKFLQAFSFVSLLMLPFMDWEMLRLGWSVDMAMCNMPFHNGGLLICCFICMIISISVFVGVCKIQFLLPNRKVHLYTYERKNKWLAIMKEVYLINRAIFRALIGRELLSRRLWTVEMTWWRKWKWKWSSKTVNVIAKKKQLNNNFHGLYSYRQQEWSQNVGLRFVVSLEVRTFWRHSMVEISVDHGKLFSTCYAKPFHVKIALFCMRVKNCSRSRLRT